MLLGPGDDAAVLAAPDGRVVATMDLLVEGRHFRRDWSSADRRRPQAAAANLADIAAMGAVPTGAARRPGGARRPAGAWALELADGLGEEARGSGRRWSAATWCAATG